MRRASAAAGALLALLVLSLLLLPETRLVVRDETGATRLSASDLTLRYRHSVERTFVEEVLVARDGGVGVSETRFASFGAGLPSQPEWGGVATTSPGRGLAVLGMVHATPEIRVRVGPVSDQTLLTGSGVVRMDALAPIGTSLTISARTLPRVAWSLAR